MCDFCSKDKETLEYAHKEAMMVSDELMALSMSYRKLANRSLKPHSKEIKTVEIRARSLIRKLVEEWI